MNFIDSFINGMAFAAGTVIVTTVAGAILFKYTRNWIVTIGATLWSSIKDEGLKLDGITLDAKVKTKKLFNKKDTKSEKK